MALAEWAAALEATPLAAFVRASVWAYPALNILHLVGLVSAVGGVLLLDLRVLGLARGLPAADVSRALWPVIAGGLTLLLLTGPLMAISDARALGGSPLFAWKLGLIAVALLNAAWFRARPLPAAGPVALDRAQAAASLTLWLGVTALGRLLGYV